MENEKAENKKTNAEENIEEGGDEETIDLLTDRFRRASRGRIVDLPRWAQ